MAGQIQAKYILQSSTYRTVLAGLQTLKAKKNRLVSTVTVRPSQRGGNKLDCLLISALTSLIPLNLSVVLPFTYGW